MSLSSTAPAKSASFIVGKRMALTICSPIICEQELLVYFRSHHPSCEQLIDIAAAIVVENKLGSLSDGCSLCLPVVLNERHDS